MMELIQFSCIIHKGDLAKAISLGEYSKTHEIKSIDDFLSVSMNVHDDGNVLEIVGMCCKYERAIIQFM